MLAKLSKRLSRRYQQRLRPEKGSLDGLLDSLHTLLMVTPKDDPFFLSRGLEMLVQHLGADLAYLVMVDRENLDTQWWAPERDGDVPPTPLRAYCQWLIDNPYRTLVLRDIPGDERWKDDPELIQRGIQAMAGAVLWEGSQIRGLVFVQFSKPQDFSRAELALLDAVTGFLGRILEVEDLKASLGRLENALAITKAVVEDSSLQDAATKLPNLRYLDIWLRANLTVATTQEEMTVAEWVMPTNAPDAQMRIKGAAELIRGADLMVFEGKDRFLLILQRTRKSLGHIFLLRLRHKLGELPMGATMWDPNSDDTQLESVRRRLDEGLKESRGLPGTPLVWKVPNAKDTPVPWRILDSP